MDTATRCTPKPKSPRGLSVKRQGECLELVSSKASEVRLLSAHSQLEVVELSLNPGVRLNVTPAGEAVETFYVLSGRLSCPPSFASRFVGAGDYIITQGLEEPATFEAVTAVRLLYVTSRPQFHEISESIVQLKKLAAEVEIKDGYTAEHCERLQRLSYATGEALGLANSRLVLLDYGAYLHDVGKIKVPLEILQKPGALTPDEWAIVKRHPIYGRELLEQTFMKEAGLIVEQHHERSDGSGYPYGLSGDAVLTEAAIVAVADTFDAMTTDRPYRRALTQAAAFRELRKYAGVHYPTEVVRAFFAAVRKLGCEGELR